MELTPALASHLTKAQSHLTHLPGLYELYRTCFASTCETVSYTHLDVYKRQTSYFLCYPFSRRRFLIGNKAPRIADKIRL